MPPIPVFISYSHRDESFREELIRHLSILKRNGVISEWHDRKIAAGDEWSREIDANLESARLILLLISSNFLASDYCYEIEMMRAMKKHAAGEARVVPIILKSCDWQDGTPFSRVQALPKDSLPITKWPDQDDAWLDVVKGLKAACREMGDLAPKLQEAAAREDPEQQLLRDYVEIEIKRHSSIKLPLLDQHGELLPIPMEAVRMELPLYLSHEHHPQSTRNTLDPETYNENNRRSHTMSLLYDRASRFASRAYDSVDIHTVQHFLKPETRLVIVGDPGCGKTTLLSRLAYSYGRKYLSRSQQGAVQGLDTPEVDHAYPNNTWLPVLLLCRDLLDYSPGDNLQPLIALQLNRLGYEHSHANGLATLLERKLTSGEAILLIDGLDEISQTRKRQEFTEFLVKKAKLSRVPMIITSRVVGFQAVKEIASDTFDFVTVAPLRDQEKKRFVEDWCAWASDEPQELSNELIPMVCYSRELAKVCESIFVLVLVVQMRVYDGDLPHQRPDIFRRAIELMIARHQKLQGTDALSINEVLPYLEYLAYQMRMNGVQKWTERQVLDTIVELHQLEPDEPEMHRRTAEAWLNDVIHGTGILNVAGISVDEKGFDRREIQFFHQSFQEYFAGQALKHGRGTASREYDAIQRIKERLEQVAIEERTVEQLGSGQFTEPVAAGQWQEVIRFAIADAPESADAAMRVILPAEAASPRDARALTIFALQCLAELPGVKEETARLVFRKVTEILNDLDGINMIKNTMLDEAVYSITRSAFGERFRAYLLQSYIETRDPIQRSRIGCTLSSSWGLSMFENREFLEVQALALELLPTLQQELRSATLGKRVDAGLKMVDTFYWLQSKKGKLEDLILPDKPWQESFQALFDLLRSQQNVALRAAALWALIWLTNARSEEPPAFDGPGEAQQALLTDIALDRSQDACARVDAALLLALRPTEKNVYSQADWIYEWAVVADGGKPQQKLPAYHPLPAGPEVAILRALLSAPEISVRIKAWAAIAMGRLGCFEELMREPLFGRFLNPVRSDQERDEALIYLVLMGGSHIANRLAELLYQEMGPSDYVQNRSFLAMMGLGDVSALHELLVQAKDDSNTDLKSFAYALAGVKDSRGRQVLRDLADHPDEKVKRAVKRALELAAKWGVDPE